MKRSRLRNKAKAPKKPALWRVMLGLDKEPKKRRRARTTAFRLWVNETQRCCMPGCHMLWPENHHLRTRGAMADKTPEEQDLYNVVPLCHVHHGECQGRNDEFADRHGLELGYVASALHHRWLKLTDQKRDFYRALAEEKNR